MVQPINVPGHGVVNFPDDMSHDEIAAAIQKNLAPPKAEVDPNAPREDAPSTAAIDLSKAHGFHEYATPIEAGKDLLRGIYDPKRGWFKGSPAMDDVTKIPQSTFSGIAPLSTDDPKRRQEIYVQQIPGAKAVEDAAGRPMVEVNGKRYYTSGNDLTLARIAAGVTGGAVLGSLAAPAGLLSSMAVGGASMGAQSVAEDVVARAAGSTSAPWVDPEKAGWATVLGAIFPPAIKGGTMLAGKLNEVLKRGVPLTDEALARAGMTPEQISSMTQEIRDKVTAAYRQTFGSSQATGATYRQGLAKHFGLPEGQVGGLTRGEISGDPGQITTEQTISQTPGGSGQPTMAANQAAQNANLSKAQSVLRAKAGSGVAMNPEEASSALQNHYDTAYDLAEKNRDILYGKARDPLQVEAAGGTIAIPATHASQAGRATREALAADNTVGPIVLGDQAKNITPMAKAALAEVDKFSQRAVGPRVDLSKTGGQTGTVYDPEGDLLGPHPPGTTTTRAAIDQPGTVTTFPDIDWEKAETLRKTLVGLEKKAAAAASAPGGDRQDLAAMQKIMQAFDDHFGPLNPLYAPARQAHADLKSTFVPGGSDAQDAATKSVLKALDGPEGGAAVVNQIFGPNVRKNTAGQMIDHLQTKVFPDNPEAQGIIKEQALRRLTVDKDGADLTPKQIVTAIEKAFGEQEGSLYGKLFTEDELHELRRFQELNRTISDARNKINPPSSGLIVQAVLKNRTAANRGAVIGSGVGTLVSPGWGTAVGAGVGERIGGAIDRIRPYYQAQHAVAPPPGYSAEPSRIPGLLSGGVNPTARDQAQTNVPGPADRLMQNILGQ